MVITNKLLAVIQKNEITFLLKKFTVSFLFLLNINCMLSLSIYHLFSCIQLLYYSIRPFSRYLVSQFLTCKNKLCFFSSIFIITLLD